MEVRALEPEGDHLHGATVAYRYDDALLADGCFYSNGHYGVGTPEESRRPIILSNAEFYDEAQLSTDVACETWFGHWLCDGLSTELLAIDREIPGLIYKRPARPHEPGYRQLLAMHSRAVTLAKVRRLWVVNDRGINHNRAARFRRLRSKVRNSVGVATTGAPGVYISRGSSGLRRNLVNEAAIEETLSGIGFDVIDPMEMSTMAIAERLHSTKVVVSIEGSQRNHALLAMPSGGAIIDIQPPQRFVHGRKFFGDIARIRNGFVVADFHPEGFWLEPDRLLRTIDLVVAEI